MAPTSPHPSTRNRPACNRHAASPTRRRVLAGLGAAAAAGLAGCFGTDDAAAPSPVAIPAGADCDECGMVIPNHPGPNAQLYWEDTPPESHEEPFRFDSLKQCFFPHYFEGEDAGRSLSAAYVTDYSAVEYEVSTSNGTPYITSHTAAGTFGDATDMHYVVESEVQGAMGPDFVPFAAATDARSFAEEYGGSVVDFEDVTPALTGT